MKIEVDMEELQALEALVYAARCHVEGHKSWVTMEQALENLDNIRNIDPGEDQGMLFDDVYVTKQDNKAEFDRIAQEINNLGLMVKNINAKINEVVDRALDTSKEKMDSLDKYVNSKNWKRRMTKDWDKPL